MKQFYVAFLLAVLIAFCAFLIWWKAWIGIPYSLIWFSILYGIATASKAPPHELKTS